MNATHTYATRSIRGTDTRCSAASTATPNGPNASIAFWCAPSARRGAPSSVACCALVTPRKSRMTANFWGAVMLNS